MKKLEKKWFNLFVNNMKKLREKKWDILSQEWISLPMTHVKKLRKWVG